MATLDASHQIVCFLTLIFLIGSDSISYFSYEKQEMVLMSNYVF
jgi:hypothetical protein